MTRQSLNEPGDRLPDLSPEGAAPDLTSSIMRRLGYERCTPAEARGVRRRRAWRAAGLVAALALVASIGVNVYRVHRAVRVPSGPTIPAALHHDLERQHERLDATLRALQRLTRPAPVTPPPEEVDPKAMAPVRWI